MQGEQGDFFYFIDCGNYDIDIHVRIGLPIGQTRALRCATGLSRTAFGRLAHSTLRQRCTAATHSASQAVPKLYHAVALCGCTAVLGTESAAQPGVEWVAYRTALMPYIVHATAQGSVIGRLEKGYFGELALLYDQPRAASIISR